MNTLSTLAPVPTALKKPPVFSREALISEEDYWQKYYEAETAYEWHNGRLEEIPVSDSETSTIYRWFLNLLEHYLDTYPIGQIALLETGFRLRLPDGVSIRKPDLAVVRHDNPAPWRPRDRSYHGIFDMCVEALSDSEPGEITRDTVRKKAEYAAAGVLEYFILHHEVRHQAFYRLRERGVYAPIPAPDGIIRSRVLPGFQFRPADLSQRPGLENMLEDEVYRDFVLTGWQRDRDRAQQAEAEVARLRALLERAKH